MSPAKILFHALRFRFRDLPFTVKQSEGNVEVTLKKDRKTQFKAKAFSFKNFETSLRNFDIEINPEKIVIGTKVPKKSYNALLNEIEKIADLIAKDNLHDIEIWGNFPNPHSS